MFKYIQEPKTPEERLQTLHEQIKVKKSQLEESREDLNNCQINVKLAEQAHVSLIGVIQSELQSIVSKVLASTNAKVKEVFQLYEKYDEKLRFEQLEV